MMRCNHARDYVAVNAADDTPEAQEHLERCPACAAYRRRHDTLDTLLQAEMRWDVPADLTAKLLMLAGPAPRVRPQGWYVTLVYILTVAAIAVSVGVAWQFMGLLASQIGLGDALAVLWAAPAQGLAELTRALPESRYLIDFFIKVRTQLLWLLMVAVLWAALDRLNPQMGFGQTASG